MMMSSECCCACLQTDEDVKAIVRMLIQCAFGQPQEASAKIPSHRATVEVTVCENAFNPLSSPSKCAQRDETIYVAFQQQISFQVSMLASCMNGPSLPLSCVPGDACMLLPSCVRGDACTHAPSFLYLGEDAALLHALFVASYVAKVKS